VIVPAKSVDGLVEAIEQLLRNPARRDQLGAAGRERILDKFCWDVCAQQMADYYHQVLAHANR